MEEKQKNTANDSNLNAGEGINIGDRNKVVNKTTNNYYCNEDDPTIRCSYCGFELNDPKNQRTELGIICYSCNQFNYDRPTSRKNTGARFQNIEAGMENKYNFYIDQIEIRLDKKKPNANQEALDYAEKAIELSELTPDAYLYKALCLYFLTTKSNLVDASADKILLLIDTSRSINENYERLRVISGMISGLYFRHINIIIVGLLNNLQSERGKTSIKSYNLQSKIFISKEREIIKFLNQIAVCYEIAPNAFFLKRELEYYFCESGRFNTENTPILTIDTADNDPFDLENILDLRNLLNSIKSNQYIIKSAGIDFNKILQEKIDSYHKIDPKWKIPPMRFYSPFGEQGMTIEEIKANLESLIQDLERKEQEARIRQQTAVELQRKEEERSRLRERDKQRLNILGIVAASVFGLCSLVWLFSAVYTWFSVQEFMLSHFLYAFLKIPLALIGLCIGSIIFILFWLLEALTAWLFGWLWNLSTSIWSWAWGDVVVNWLWKETGGIYLFLGTLIWMVIVRIINYINSK